LFALIRFFAGPFSLLAAQTQFYPSVTYTSYAAIRRALGLRSTEDPLFQIEKVFDK